MKYIIDKVYASGGTVFISGDVWSNGVNLGARNVVLPAVNVMLIVEDDELNDNQKKIAIRDLVIAQVQSWRMVEAYNAAEAVKSLGPSLPVALTFDPAPLPEQEE